MNVGMYQFDQTTGFLTALNYASSSQRSVPLMNPNYGFFYDFLGGDPFAQALGLTYNTVNKKFYTVNVGTVYNDTVRWLVRLLAR